WYSFRISSRSRVSSALSSSGLTRAQPAARTIAHAPASAFRAFEPITFISVSPGSGKVLEVPLRKPRSTSKRERGRGEDGGAAGRNSRTAGGGGAPFPGPGVLRARPVRRPAGAWRGTRGGRP